MIKIYDKLPQEAKDIREEVFMKEQSFTDEFDDTDDISKHFVLFINEKPAATCRVFFDNDKGSYMIGRIAVIKEFRGKGLGEKTVKAAEQYIKEAGGASVKVSSQVRASAFYKKLGYRETGGIYLDEDCPHIMMEKKLNISPSESFSDF
ncbi:MAG: GNAT family N-acetyltransferase [Eubacterium sp.]